ncbi:MAG: tetratricopeptide repeat protein [Lentisphaeria bacterium]|nr:tetratricopeptide repeat protein [Candidatus Neomarinimicrobiota bacterium]MCF7841713.1 tetratricopeptide repeat protein [Lentisphaeria bacterium]
MRYLKKPSQMLILLLAGLMMSASGQTQLSFSRPGLMMNIPTTSLYPYPYLLRVGIGTQYLGKTAAATQSTQVWNRGLYLETDITRSFRLGISTVQQSNSTAPTQLALHVQDRLLTYGEAAIGVGVSDIVFDLNSGGNNESVSEQVRNLSYYMLISRENSFSEYNLKTYLGVGTGRYGINFGKTVLDSSLTDVYTDLNSNGIWDSGEAILTDYNNNGFVDTVFTDMANSFGIFIGMLLNTNIMAERGGMDFMVEWDGSSVNMGLRIPLTLEYKVNLAFSNMQNIPNFGDATAEKPPAITVGLDYFLPRVKKQATRGRGLAVEGVVTEDGIPVRTVIDSAWHKAQENQIILLQDSLRMTAAEIEQLNRMVEQLEQRNKVLEDSIATMKLAQHVSQARVNQALKHLSRSLRLFYNEEYPEALAEVNRALELNPNLALAYARRGSIYYKMGQLDRATINWNLALQIDPGYDDVRNILRALNENRLRTTTTFRD